MKKTEYITVDLVVKTNHAVDQLIEALSAKDYFVQKLEWSDGHDWYLNVSGPHEKASPGKCIDCYCKDISSLPCEAHAEWQNAEFKEFFLGYRVGEQPHCYESHIENTTVTKAAQLGAGIGLALYPAQDEEAEQNIRQVSSEAAPSASPDEPSM